MNPESKLKIQKKISFQPSSPRLCLSIVAPAVFEPGARAESKWIRSNIDLFSDKVYHFLCPEFQVLFSFASFCFAGIA